jgi:hypothetical protein
MVRHGDNTSIALPFSVQALGGGARVQIGTYAPQIHLHIHVHVEGDAEPALNWMQKIMRRLFGPKDDSFELSPEQAQEFLKSGVIPMPLPGQHGR